MFTGGLTKRQDQCLTFIKAELAAGRLSPTVREICLALGVTSKGNISGHLRRLVERGYLAKTARGSRCFAIVELSCPHCGYPLRESHAKARALPGSLQQADGCPDGASTVRVSRPAGGRTPAQQGGV